MSESESTAKFNSQVTAFGINPSKIYRNLSVEKLVEISVEKNEGLVTSTSSLSVKTGKYTGRSPDDRFIVFDDLTHDKVHWGKVNKQIPTETFEKFFKKMKKFVGGKELFVFDGLEKLNPKIDGVRIGHSVGTKKRKEIVIKSIEKKFKIFNARVSERASKS